VAAFGEQQYVRDGEAVSTTASGSVSTRSFEATAKLHKIAQEFKRPAFAAPHSAGDFVAEAYREACEKLEKRILAHMPGGHLDLAVTDNRHTMISVKREAGPVYRARVHHMFLEAPPVIARALARYIASNESEASRELGVFIEDHQTDIGPRKGKSSRGKNFETLGKFFDLQEIFNTLNQRYFAGSIDARVTWGERGSSQRRRRVSMKMGSYSVEERLIRIHPSLDRDFVPRHFVEWIMFHEMLHQVHPIPVIGGRRQFHTPAFLAQERTFHDYHRARDWERRNLDRLLTY
jgi:hypothetical protein